jgi:putative peptide zinc metalloprotease protein
MNQSLFSTYWYRVANLKPVVRDAVGISRHVYRGEIWYVLKNALNPINHRFTARAYSFIAQMDGEKSVEQIWENLDKNGMDDTPTQDEIIRLLGQLNDAQLIQSDILPSTVELVRQFSHNQNNNLKQKVSNPFSMKFSLFDPDKFLEKWSFLARPLFTRNAFVLWLIIVGAALVTGILNWSELSYSLSDQLISTNNLVLLWLIYPLVKILHESGHGFALKKWGGEVHEMGIMFLAMMPIPYVDATASGFFSEKRHRIIVAAMGMMVELFIASLALFVWLHVETGLVSVIAYNLMLICGISSLLFNGNPLMRYDAYYILADFLEIPNLAQRSHKYLGYLLRRYLFSIKSAESPAMAQGEKIWFLLYGPTAFCYRILVLTGLIWLFSQRFFFIGILIALWGIATLLVIPLIRGIHRFLSSPGMENKRFRLMGMVGGVLLGGGWLIFIFPMPLWTTAQGVVWLPEQSMVRAGTDCELVTLSASAGQKVTKDQALFKGKDPFLETQKEVYKALLEELYASYNAQPLNKRVKRTLLLEEIQVVKADFEDIKDRLNKLLVCSPARGDFILASPQYQAGVFVKKGELLGYILNNNPPTVRAVVRQTDIGLLRKQTTRVLVRLAEKPTAILDANLKQIAPAATVNLPSTALGIKGGGDIPVDPTDPEGLRSLDTIFQVDINLPQGIKTPHIGQRVYIRFEHGTMPLASQWYRSLRQLFLRNFYV